MAAFGLFSSLMVAFSIFISLLMKVLKMEKFGMGILSFLLLAA
jgi:hypothetical protein